jgi:hypothetical protein
MAAPYLTLIASLPYLGLWSTAKQTPVSRIKLDGRLRMLQAEHAQRLGEIEDLLQWSHQPMARTDAANVAQTRQLLARLDSAALREIVQWRMELRTAVAGLRRRKRGESAPPAGESWGVGRWVGHMQRYWTEPGFHLEGVFPWLLTANRLLAADDSLGLERLLLGVVWDQLGRQGEGHYFDFEAVVVYVLRWNIIDRWTTYAGEAAAERFTTLVDAGLGEFAEVFA